MHHIMMLRQQHFRLLHASAVQSYQRTLSNNITLLGVQYLDRIELVDLVILGCCVRVYHMAHVKDFHTPDQGYFGS